MGAPTYTFTLRSDGCDVNDNVGIELADNASAYGYARTVARELMRCRETQTRYWQIKVYRVGEGLLYDVLFASVDPTLDHLRREVRAWVERISERKRALKDLTYECEATLRESRSLVARSRGQPYLISENGELTIRDFHRPPSAHG
jgi:Domain of unknown function (DUF6894)